MSKKNNENKKLGIIAAFVALIVILIIAVSFQNSNQSKEVLKNFDQAFASNSNVMVYLGRPTCSYCQLTNPIVADFVTKYDLKYTYINTDLISSTQLGYILDKLGVESSDFGTPYMAIVKDSKKIDEQIGYVEAKALFTFLQKNTIIASDKVYVETVVTNNLTQIDYSTYASMKASSTPSIIVVGKTGCSYCEAAIPVLSELVTEYKLTINYFNLANVSEADYKLVGKDLSSQVNANWGTPTLIIVQNGKITKYLIGFDSTKGKTPYVTFFKDNKFIK